MTVPSAVLSIAAATITTENNSAGSCHSKTQDDDHGLLLGNNNNNNTTNNDSSLSSSSSSDISSSIFTSSLSSFELQNDMDDDDDDDSSNDDAIANIIGPLMQQRGNFISHALAERVSCIDSIVWLGHHLPESVVAFLMEEIEGEEQGKHAPETVEEFYPSEMHRQQQQGGMMAQLSLAVVAAATESSEEEDDDDDSSNDPDSSGGSSSSSSSSGDNSDDSSSISISSSSISSSDDDDDETNTKESSDEEANHADVDNTVDNDDDVDDDDDDDDDTPMNPFLQSPLNQTFNAKMLQGMNDDERSECSTLTADSHQNNQQQPQPQQELQPKASKENDDESSSSSDSSSDDSSSDDSDDSSSDDSESKDDDVKSEKREQQPNDTANQQENSTTLCSLQNTDSNQEVQQQSAHQTSNNSKDDGKNSCSSDDDSSDSDDDDSDEDSSDDDDDSSKESKHSKEAKVPEHQQSLTNAKLVNEATTNASDDKVSSSSKRMESKQKSSPIDVDEYTTPFLGPQHLICDHGNNSCLGDDSSLTSNSDKEEGSPFQSLQVQQLLCNHIRAALNNHDDDDDGDSDDSSSSSSDDDSSSSSDSDSDSDSSEDEDDNDDDDASKASNNSKAKEPEHQKSTEHVNETTTQPSEQLMSQSQQDACIDKSSSDRNPSASPCEKIESKQQALTNDVDVCPTQLPQQLISDHHENTRLGDDSSLSTKSKQQASSSDEKENKGSPFQLSQVQQLVCNNIHAALEDNDNDNNNSSSSSLGDDDDDSSSSSSSSDSSCNDDNTSKESNHSKEQLPKQEESFALQPEQSQQLRDTHSDKSSSSSDSEKVESKQKTSLTDEHPSQLRSQEEIANLGNNVSLDDDGSSLSKSKQETLSNVKEENEGNPFQSLQIQQLLYNGIHASPNDGDDSDASDDDSSDSSFDIDDDDDDNDSDATDNSKDKAQGHQESKHLSEATTDQSKQSPQSQQNVYIGESISSSASNSERIESQQETIAVEQQHHGNKAGDSSLSGAKPKQETSGAVQEEIEESPLQIQELLCNHIHASLDDDSDGAGNDNSSSSDDSTTGNDGNSQQEPSTQNADEAEVASPFQPMQMQAMQQLSNPINDDASDVSSDDSSSWSSFGDTSTSSDEDDDDDDISNQDDAASVDEHQASSQIMQPLHLASMINSASLDNDSSEDENTHTKEDAHTPLQVTPSPSPRQPKAAIQQPQHHLHNNTTLVLSPPPPPFEMNLSRQSSLPVASSHSKRAFRRCRSLSVCSIDSFTQEQVASALAPPLVGLDSPANLTTEQTQEALDNENNENNNDINTDDNNNNLIQQNQAQQELDHPSIMLPLQPEGRDTTETDVMSADEVMNMIINSEDDGDHGDSSSSSSSDSDSNPNIYFPDDFPPATRHDCALLFVDISGFTKLSTTLEIEQLSKTINEYFQMIVEEVEAFGGDILKFAGDAIFCEWQATTASPLETSQNSLSQGSQSSFEPWHGLDLEECVLTAAACGARIVAKCSEYPVYDAGREMVTTLSVHCAVGFGEVVGVHVGDRETRMEYLILGNPIEQVAGAIDMASRGEVVASPEALIILEDSAELDSSLLDTSKDEPQVIARQSDCMFYPKGKAPVDGNDWTLYLKDNTIKPSERLAKRCEDWNLAALARLRERMAKYVHSVVVNDEFGTKTYPGQRFKVQDRHRSEAELRSVYTLFLMPLIATKLSGDDQEDCKVLVLLNDMMLIVTRELARYQGHLRQFIVDDKGVVFIANFGLRGSTFPNMIAERAIPFSTSVQKLLKSELNTDTRMGATYEEVYCGVVGGVTRHEFAVLGPSVNLAARLMASKDNKGFVVDEMVKDKVRNGNFRALDPVKAKGYSNLVPIFEPLEVTVADLKDRNVEFSCLDAARTQLSTIAESIVEDEGPAKVAIVFGEGAVRKSDLCTEVIEEIKEKCVFTEGEKELIVLNSKDGNNSAPFSAIRPIVMELVESKDCDTADNTISEAGHVSQAIDGDEGSPCFLRQWRDLVSACDDADISPPAIESICRLLLSNTQGAESVNGACGSTTLDSEIASLLLQLTRKFGLVVLFLDNLVNVDAMSWKVLEMLYQESLNLLIVGATQTLNPSDLKMGDFLEALKKDGVESSRYSEIPFPTTREGEVATRRDSLLDLTNVEDVDMPNLISELLEALGGNEQLAESNRNLFGSDEPVGNVLDGGDVEELVLSRLDEFPSSVRTHLNLGAILGLSFDLVEVITIFEKHRGIQELERMTHALSVRDSLAEAVEKGVLKITEAEVSLESPDTIYDHPYLDYSITYEFTLAIWRTRILRLTLAQWKRDMHGLIAESLENALDQKIAVDINSKNRLFFHWKESGNAKKTTALALEMGLNLEELGLTRKSLAMYKNSLAMWKAMSRNDEADWNIGGLSVSMLEEMESSDVEHLIRLHVALGRCHNNVLEPKDGIFSYQTALNFIHKAPSSIHLQDRSIIFPVFSGLFDAVCFGSVGDENYERGLVKMFLRETKNYGHPVHYSRALAMQAEMLARHGRYEAALQIVAELQEKYHVEEHSTLVSQSYGSDRCCQCIAQSSLWQRQLGNNEEAMLICDAVLKNMLPRMDQKNVQSLFQILYPIIWVMKDAGKAKEAREGFDRFIVQNARTHLDKEGQTSDTVLHVPIMALLDLVATAGETTGLDEYAQWVLEQENGSFCSELNFMTGSMGRTADSITAELCLHLAKDSFDRKERRSLLEKGYKLAHDAKEQTRPRRDKSSLGQIIAFGQVKPVFEELLRLNAKLHIERNYKRGTCGF